LPNDRRRRTRFKDLANAGEAFAQRCTDLWTRVAGFVVIVGVGAARSVVGTCGASLSSGITDVVRALVAVVAGSGTAVVDTDASLTAACAASTWGVVNLIDLSKAQAG
jgi:hypothetical protein